MSESDNWTPEELETLKGQDRPPLVLNRIDPRPHKACLIPTTTLRWYRGPMCADTDRILQQRWVDILNGAEEWREIEVFLED